MLTGFFIFCEGLSPRSGCVKNFCCKLKIQTEVKVVRVKAKPFRGLLLLNWNGGKGIQTMEGVMAVVKVIEIIAQSPRSWEDAAQTALAEVTNTIESVQSLYVKDLQAVVEDGKIRQFRLNAKISFLVREEKRKQEV